MPSAAAAPAASPAKRASDRIPGPRWLPGLGASLMFVWRPIGFVSWLRRRYGPIVALRDSLLGDLAYVSDPKLIGQIFKGDPEQLHAGETNRVLEPILGPHSVLLLDGAQHMRMRKLLMPPFHGEAIGRYEELIEEITLREVERMPVGVPFAMRDAMQAITLEVILRAVFGVSEPRRASEMRAVIPRFLNISLWIALERLRIDLGPRSPWGRFIRARRRFDELIYDEIRHRRERGADEDRGFDIFSLLLAARDEDGNPLTDRELRDELVTMLVAGHETTATALAWAFERLLRHPDKLARLQAEIDAGEDDAYLEAVCKEILRVRPVIMDVGRRLTRPLRLGGYDIPPGTNLMPGIAAVHHNEDVYDDPAAFKPERFLDGRLEPNAWIPFGGGVRRCLGAAFAQFEMKVVLRTVLQHAVLRAPDPKPERIKFRHITLVPGKGGRVVLVGKRTGSDAEDAHRELAGAVT
jgi:cytochrome P450